MVRRGNRQSRRTRLFQAFTLIELLVVVAIIALLISIMLPSLNKSRAQARAIKCAANLRHVSVAVSAYTSEYRGTFPICYVYAKDERGAYDVYRQAEVARKPAGYIHWSWFLYNTGKAPAEAFQCPDFDRGGAPRTFPGLNGSDWEAGQVDDHGKSGSSAVCDKQLPRMSYTANAAIMPRNKFTLDMSEGPRVNRYVRENEIQRTQQTILATEFLNSWKAIGVQQGSGILVKSHRPIQPFYHLSTGTNEYTAPLNNGSFTYGDTSSPTLGIKPYAEVKDMVGVIDGTAGPEVNAVGRHHPGGDKIVGGTANFLFSDGHVERSTVLNTLKRRLWGDRYYALTGANKIMR